MKFPVYIAPVLLALSITSVAYAEEGSTSDWLSNAGYGLMAHYEVFGVDEISPEEYNRRVNSFNVDSFVKQVKESGAGYFILTLGQNSGYYCAPNRTYDKLLGVEPGQKTATRDLPLELGKALQKENIRLMLYLPSRAPQRDAKAMSALGDVSERQPAPQIFIKNWSDICREWSERYGKLVSGWWFDGYKKSAASGWANLQAEYNWKTWAEAVRAGNPDAELAFNLGRTIPYERANGAQTYTGGHATKCWGYQFEWPLPPETAPPEGMTWHHLTLLGTNWGGGALRYTGDNAERMFHWVDKINALDGVITFDVPLSSEGVIPESFMTILRELAKKNRKD